MSTLQDILADKGRGFTIESVKQKLSEAQAVLAKKEILHMPPKRERILRDYIQRLEEIEEPTAASKFLEEAEQDSTLSDILKAEIPSPELAEMMDFILKICRHEYATNYGWLVRGMADDPDAPIEARESSKKAAELLEQWGTMDEATVKKAKEVAEGLEREEAMRRGSLF